MMQKHQQSKCWWDGQVGYGHDQKAIGIKPTHFLEFASLIVPVFQTIF
jgi:hypothetical protein